MGRVKVYLNEVEIPVLEVDNYREGERQQDTLEIKVPPNVYVKHHDKLQLVVDVVPLDSLQAIYHYESDIVDESGHNRHWKLDQGTEQYEVGKYARAVLLDGSTRYKRLSGKFTFTGKFHIMCWMRRTSSDDVDTIFGYSADTNPSASKLAFGGTSGGIPKNHLFFRAVEGGASINADIGFTDAMLNTYVFIMIKRDENNVVTASINNASPVTVGTLAGTWEVDLLGDNANSGQKFKGAFDTTRLYNDNLTSQEVTHIYSLKWHTMSMKFGGRVSSVNDKVLPREVVAKSFGAQLNEVIMGNNILTNTSPEAVMQEMVEANTTLRWVNHSTPSGIVIEKYVIDGYPIDSITQLAKMSGKIFRTDGLECFILEDLINAVTTIEYEHGRNCTIMEDTTKEPELWNDITILGAIKTYNQTETFNGDGTNKVFTLAKPPVTTNVKVDGVEQKAEIDYAVDTEARTITFIVAPPIGSNNVAINYDYEEPIRIKQFNQASITANGKRSKRLIVPSITTYKDGVVFASRFLSAYKDVRKQYKVILPVLDVQPDENIVVKLKQVVKEIDATFIVKSIEMLYPQSKMFISCGEFNFDQFEAEKYVIEKLHALEDIIVSAKDVRAYEQALETLNLTATADASEITTLIYGAGAYGVNTYGDGS